MRTILLLLFLLSINAVAQHPLVGTWHMITAKGIGADGEGFFLDTTSVRETKIITPTHYMLIAWDVENDSLIFNRTMGGRVRIEGKKYIETPTQASVQIFDNVNADFEWKRDGEIFTQSGTIVRPDGKKVILEALIFQRETDAATMQAKKSIQGAWTQVTDVRKSTGINSPSSNESVASLLILTPTHWMRMTHKNQKFDGVMYGGYSPSGGETLGRVIYSTYPMKTGDHVRFAEDGNGALEFTWNRETAKGPETFTDRFAKAR